MPRLPPGSARTVTRVHHPTLFRSNQQPRAAALNLVTAAMILVNWRYLGHAGEEMRRRGSQSDPAMLSWLSPLGWDRINLTGDYVWSDHLDLDANGLMPLLIKPLQ